MDFDRSVEYRKRAHDLIPGGAHTYAKGDDQYPVDAPGFIARGDQPFFSVDDWFIGTTPMNAGVPTAVTDLTVGFRYNDQPCVPRALRPRRDDHRLPLGRWERPGRHWISPTSARRADQPDDRGGQRCARRLSARPRGWRRRHLVGRPVQLFFRRHG